MITGNQEKETIVIVRERVVTAAHERMKSRSWFRGVCTDYLDDFLRDCPEGGFERAVDFVEMQTAYWDDPDFGKKGNNRGNQG